MLENNNTCLKKDLILENQNGFDFLKMKKGDFP